MNRFDRITAILIHLQSKKIVGAQEMADRFEISLRTVYRDIRSLEEAGVPVIGEKGLGYSIMEGYRLPPVMFTEEEVIAFLMAEKVLENYADIHNSELILGLTATGKPFYKEHPTMKAYFEQVAKKQASFPVVIAVKPDKARYLQEQKFNYGFVSEQPVKDHIQMSFDAPCLEAFSRWYITFADFASIVKPASLKVLLKERLEAVLKAIV